MTRFALLLVAVALSFAQQPEFVPIPAASDGSPKAFSITKTEVTVEQFQSFVAATGYVTKAELDKSSRNWRSPGYPVQPKLPVTYVTVLDAVAFCSWLGARLPTDSEWEHAARAGTTTRHFWGDAIDPTFLWYRTNSNDSPQPVATRKPNPYGLYDIEGNVWEWTAPAGADMQTANGNRRGGSWIDCENIEVAPGKEGKDSAPLIGIGTSFAVPIRLNHRYDDIGFRCAMRSPGS